MYLNKHIKRFSIFSAVFLSFIMIMILFKIIFDNNDGSMGFMEILIIIVISVFLLFMLYLLRRYLYSKYTDIRSENNVIIFIKGNGDELKKNFSDIHNVKCNDRDYIFEFCDGEEIRLMINIYSAKQIKSISEININT